jgi:hypothetical protein
MRQAAYRLHLGLYYLALGLWLGSLALFALVAMPLFYRMRLYQPQITATPPGSPPMDGPAAQIIAGDIASRSLANLATVQIIAAVAVVALVALQCTIFRRWMARAVTSATNLVRLALLGLALAALVVQLSVVSPRMHELRPKMYAPEASAQQRAERRATFEWYHTYSERSQSAVVMLLTGAVLLSPFVLTTTPAGRSEAGGR